MLCDEELYSRHLYSLTITLALPKAQVPFRLICCRFVVQQAVRQMTTNPSSGVWAYMSTMLSTVGRRVDNLTGAVTCDQS